ncbi:hypothetical protein E8E13_010552 [Curvularia kusanoi]|uniref:Protein kinase domain-containing protein n=1 Tax=Curvularia kusanoi TaxID=90978 RepID=A0A9P4TNW4_CURKU|nr:hypothetical protein E8E13_010552 [Curvularia kusanoi]
MSKRRFRLYADFATGGAMDSAILKYHLGWHTIVDERIPLQGILPEAFIWYVIRALATALIVLQHGTLGDEAVTDWKPIMHLDIQPANILLDVQNRKRRRSEDDAPGSALEGPSKRRKTDREVIPQLADFGLSFFDLDFSHGPELDENPQDHILPDSDSNTRYAPEHQIFVDENSQRLDEKTDVWGIGRIAWTLIVNRLNQEGPVREGGPLVEGRALPLSQIHDANMEMVQDRYDQEVLVGSDAWPAARRYSEELKTLVRDCLKYFKDNRPSAKEVLRRVDRHLDANPGLREEMADPHGTLLEFPDDGAFEIGDQLIAHRPSG